MSTTSETKKLLKAGGGGRIEKVETLLNDGSTPTNITGKDRRHGTALHMASLKGQREIVELLLNDGALLEAKTPKLSATALIFACGGGHDGIVKLLLDRGADIHTIYKNGSRQCPSQCMCI